MKDITHINKGDWSDQKQYAIRVGEMYQPSEETRSTTIRVDDLDIEVTENLWRDVDERFDTEYKWSVTVDFNLPKDCGTRDELLTAVSDNVRIVKALGVLGYELRQMEEPSVGTWDRPAEDREA